MSVSSDLLFPVIFLISLFVVWTSPRSGIGVERTLLVASFCALLLISPRAALVPIVSCAVTFPLGVKLQTHKQLGFLLAALAVPLLILLGYRYGLPAAQDAGFIEKVAIPVGISYYTFKQLHFLIESHRGHFTDMRFQRYLAYILYFPMFVAGPIERYNNFASQLQHWQRPTLDQTSLAIERIGSGLIKKLLISDLILAPFVPEDITTDELLTMEWHEIALISFIKFLKIYMDFSGYSDIAIGLSMLYGIKLMENFNFPLGKSNLAEFWRAWHISLSSWARDYVYFPVLGRWRTPSIALVLTMMTIGAWHSLAPGWLLWGLHHGIGLAVLAYYHRKTRRYKSWRKLTQTRLWQYLGMISVWFYVSIGHALTFVPESIGTSLALYGKLWGVY